MLAFAEKTSTLYEHPLINKLEKQKIVKQQTRWTLSFLWEVWATFPCSFQPINCSLKKTLFFYCTSLSSIGMSLHKKKSYYIHSQPPVRAYSQTHCYRTRWQSFWRMLYNFNQACRSLSCQIVKALYQCETFAFAEETFVLIWISTYKLEEKKTVKQIQSENCLFLWELGVTAL